MLRKSVHLSVLGFPIAYHFLKIELRLIQFFLFFLVISFLFSELYRLKFNENFFVNKITRQSEKSEVANYLFTMTIWLLITLGANGYDFVLAELAIISTHLGDAAAAVGGKGFGKHKLMFTENKTWEGLITGIAVAILSGILLLGSLGYWTTLWWAIIPGIVLGFLDLFEDLPNWMADNMFNPTISLALLIFLVG